MISSFFTLKSGCGIILVQAIMRWPGFWEGDFFMPHPEKQIPASIGAVLSYNRKRCFVFLFFIQRKKTIKGGKAPNAKKIINWFAHWFSCE